MVADQTDYPVMVITGTRTGIGRGLAEYFIAKKYKVVGCSRGPSSLKSEFYDHAQLDVGDERQVVAWIRSVKHNHGRIDVLVSNAGLAPAALLLTMTPGEVLEPLIRTNVLGTYYVCREVAKVMALRRAGRIVTVSSMAVGLHEEGTSAYSASKSAIVEMTKILAKELAPLGITCNVMAPSMIMTDAVKALSKEIAERALAKLTIRRKVTLDEIGNVISFLAAPESSCITGQVIHMGLVS
jgi:3-oxoacyl-[acyl-carrier protein] reductase